MDTFQKAFEKILDEVFDPDTLRLRYIIQNLQRKGFEVTKEQEQEIGQQLKSLGNHDSLLLSLPGAEGEIDLGSEADIEAFLNDVYAAIPELYADSLQDISDSLLKGLKQDAPRMLKEHEKRRKRFESKLHATWGRALRLLEVLIVIATEAGDRVNDDLREKAALEEDFVFEVIAHLHARACQIANEILTLLKAGYADGAHSRWRSLHEITVVTYFIKDNDKQVAKRFLDHQAISILQAANTYAEHCNALGYAPLSQEEFEHIKFNRNKLVQEYGKEFANENGWAAFLIDNNPNPKFHHIEAAVGLSHQRPFYKLASYNVHAGPMRIHNSLGLTNIEDNRLLTGPSVIGLCTPLHSTAIAMMQITIAFLGLEPTLDNVALGKVLQSFATQIGEAGAKAEKIIQD